MMAHSSAPRYRDFRRSSWLRDASATTEGDPLRTALFAARSRGEYSAEDVLESAHTPDTPLEVIAQMGILDRFARSVKANVNSLIDKAEDPAKVIAQTIEDMQDELKKAKQEHVQALASVKQLERKVADHVKESEEWERKAMLALEHGDEELAREALRRKKKSEADAVEADRLRGQQATYSEDIKASIDAMEKKVDELKAKRSSLAAAVARSRTTPGSDPLAEKSGAATPALARLKEMTDKIENLEAEAEAHDLLDDPKKADLEDRFRKLEKGEKKDQLDDEIAALKARLKK